MAYSQQCGEREWITSGGRCRNSLQVSGMDCVRITALGLNASRLILSSVNVLAVTRNDTNLNEFHGACSVKAGMK